MQSLPSIKGIGAIYSTSAQWINGMLTSGDYPWAADVPEATATEYRIFQMQLRVLQLQHDFWDLQELDVCRWKCNQCGYEIYMVAQAWWNQNGNYSVGYWGGFWPSTTWCWLSDWCRIALRRWPDCSRLLWFKYPWCKWIAMMMNKNIIVKYKAWPLIILSILCGSILCLCTFTNLRYFL